MSDNYMIKAADNAVVQGLAKTHFLNDNAKRTSKSLGDLTGLTGFGFLIIEVAPGCVSTEHHVHHFEEEYVYALSGEATAYLGEDPVTIGPGDFLGYRRAARLIQSKTQAPKYSAPSLLAKGWRMMWPIIHA
ncbi:MAG: cupin domain-containing protein [Pikeienuella sp.]